MSEEVKAENTSVETATVEVPVVEAPKEEPKKEENFSIEILGEKGEKYYFTGPESSTAPDRERIIYSLFSHFAYHRIQHAIIQQAKADEAKKAAEHTSVEVKEEVK